MAKALLRYVPVVDHSGHPIAAVAVTFASDDPPDLAETVRRTRATAARLSRRLGGQPAG